MSIEMQGPEINKLAEALTKAQAEISGAHKDSTNPHFKTKYADLESVWDACRVPLTKNGLSVIQTLHKEDVYVLRTTLCHLSGQFVSSDCPLLLTRNDMQGLGSAITYARRYGLSAIVGVSPSDDDANSVVNLPPAKVDAYPAAEALSRFAKNDNALVSANEVEALFKFAKDHDFKMSELKELCMKKYKIGDSAKLKKYQYRELLECLRREEERDEAK